MVVIYVGWALLAVLIAWAGMWSRGASFWVYLVGTGAMLPPTIRRLHDVGSGWWPAIAMLFPITGWLLLIFLALMPGRAAENRWGAPPAPRRAPAA
jgi:uncharacterized membrane protein YhaH (DUF805 family)